MDERDAVPAARQLPPWWLASREGVAWLALLAAAAATRLWDLGSRVLSHDESLHAHYSWLLATRWEYAHSPSLHGPLLYHLDALVFLLLGASDTTARLLPGLAGVLCIAMLLPFRRYLGAGGALAAGALALISPVLLFYSRYLRNDVYIALFSLLWVWALFRYLETRSPRWLYLLSGAMALSLVCKEVAFIQGLIFGLYALLRAVLWRGDRRDFAAGDATVTMLTLVLPFAAGGLHVLVGWPIAYDGDALTLRRTALGMAVLVAAAAGLALAWFGGRRPGSRARGGPGLAVWARCAALLWGLALALFTTLGTNLRSGVVSGFVGSLGYWLGQHEVARGSQPWFYYLLLGGMYELLPIALALAAVLWLVFRRRAAAAPRAAGGDLVEVAAVAHPSLQRELLAFCAWWATGGWIAYSAAGEKMPWLLVHPMVPLYLLGGWSLARLLAATAGPLRSRRPAQLAALAGALLPVALVALSGGGVAGAAPATAASAMRALVQAATVTLLLAVVAWAGRRLGGRAALRAGAAGLVAAGALWTCRTAWQASFVHDDLPIEPIVYAHSAPDVKTVLRELELISLRTVGERQLEVAYHPEVSWPFAWYLRDFPNARVLGLDADPGDPAVLLAASPPPPELWRHVTDRFVSRTYRFMWWPAQDYIGRTPRELLRWLGDSANRAALRHVLLFRRYRGATPGTWPHRKDLRMYVRPDLDALGGELPYALAGVPPRPRPHLPVAEWSWHPEAILTGPFAGRALDGPTAIAATGDGGWVLADSGNSRVLRLDAAGLLRHEISLGDAREQARGSSRPGEAWGVAVRDDGSFVVADTWRGLIRSFDAAGREVASRGRFGTASLDRPGDPALFGPRGLAFDREGLLVVADTGNHRLLGFGARGELVERTDRGTAGAAFAEPVGLALDGEGRLLVADTWNQRIQRLGTDLQPLESWPMPGWESRSAVDKPFLAVDDEGRIYATDPAGGRLVLFSPRGAVLGGVRLPALAGGQRPRPVGVAWDRVGGRLAVCDWEGDRVLLFLPATQEAALD